MKKISTELPLTIKCEIALGSHFLFSDEIIAELRPLAERFALFCDEQVAAAFGQKWCAHLEKKGISVSLFTFPAGERFKTREQKAELEDLLLSQKFGRNTCCIALGGGVTTDLIGFLASTFCRGVPLINVPTTLLAMVDAAIGGKTGVDTRWGKNLIGSFYLPSKIWIDTAVLDSLPSKEWTNGFAEVIKYALIRSPALFQTLQKSLGKDKTALYAIIEESIRIKLQVITEDFHEKTGLRRILNFGHTIAHAIEQTLNYQIAHGQAVAIGMLVESYLSWKTGHLSASHFKEIETLIRAFGFDLKLDTVRKEDIISAFSADKKTRGGVPHFVLLDKIGFCCPFDGKYCSPAPPALLDEALDWMASQFVRR